MSSQIRRLSTVEANFAEQFRALLAYEEQRDPHVKVQSLTSFMLCVNVAMKPCWNSPISLTG